MQDKQAKLSPEELFDSLPPQNLEAERAVLGSILLDPPLIEKANSELEPGDFYVVANRQIFEAFLDMRLRNIGIDPVTLIDRLKRLEVYKDIGAAYIAEIIQSSPFTVHLSYYAAIIKRCRAQRLAIHFASDMLREAYSDSCEPVEWCQKLRQRGADMAGWLKTRGLGK